jgi:hypothetical protein
VFRSKYLARALGVLALGVGITVAATVHSPTRSVASTPPGALTSGFQDKSSSDYLRVQLDSSSGNYGAFIVALPGVGLVWPTQVASASIRSDHSTQLRYDGNGYLDAQAHLDPEFGVTYEPSGQVQQVSLRLIGQVDAAHGTGSLEIWVAGVHYHFASSRVTSGADAVVQQVLTAYQNADWNALYGLADSSVRQSMTQEQFAGQISQAFAGLTVTGASTGGAISYSTSTTGIDYASVPFTVSLRRAGPSKTFSGTLILINDQGAWRWFTTKPNGG